MIIQDLNFCEAYTSVSEIVGGADLFSPFSFSESVSGSFTSTIGAFTSVANTSGGSLFQGTVKISPTTGVVNGVTFISSFFAAKTVQVATGTLGIIV